MTATAASADLDDRSLTEFLDNFFDTQVAQASRYGEHYRRLWRATRDAADGGKRLRPALMMLTYNHLSDGVVGRSDAVTLAAALELLHTAYVIHDDVIDRDLVRRGKPNVAGRAVVEAIDHGALPEVAASYGRASAILAGDLLISAAHTLVAGLDAPADRRRAVLALLAECVVRTAAGEHADVWVSVAGSPSAEQVLAVIENKTAAYSFGVPLQCGALLAGASPQVIAGLGQVGLHLGLAFQLRDDVLGVFGDERITGKSAIGDLREGKQTLLVAYARRDRRWRRVQHEFGRPDLDEAGADELRRLIRSSGALARVEATIVTELDRAAHHIASLAVPEPLRQALAATAATVAGRSR